jgi:DNA-binding NtrC family response regulator
MKLLPPRVLIVEDEPRMREMLMRAVGELGLEAATVRSAEQALRMLDAADDPPWTILVLDLNLPGAGGLECLEAARAHRPYVQAIVLTGFGDLTAAQRAIRLDVIDFLTKPFVLQDLESALARAQERLRAFGITGQHLIAGDVTIARADHDPHDVAEDPPTLAEVERDHILAALARHAGNRAAAARDLGISERTLYYRLGRYQQRHPGTAATTASRLTPGPIGRAGDADR